jgi:hypothetical protein
LRIFFLHAQQCRAEFNNAKELGRHDAMTGYNNFADFFSMHRNAGQNSTIRKGWGATWQ